MEVAEHKGIKHHTINNNYNTVAVGGRRHAACSTNLAAVSSYSQAETDCEHGEMGPIYFLQTHLFMLLLYTHDVL